MTVLATVAIGLLLTLQLARHVLLLFDWDFRPLALRTLLPNSHLFSPSPGPVAEPAVVRAHPKSLSEPRWLPYQPGVRMHHIHRDVARVNDPING